MTQNVMIETERLILRKFEYTDDEAMLKNWVADEKIQSLYSEPVYSTKEAVKGLLDKGYTPDLVSMQGIGYKEFIPYFNGECALEEAITQLKTNTRRFAKRQLTWFRRQIEGLWVDMDQSDGDKVMENVLDYLKQKEIL